VDIQKATSHRMLSTLDSISTHAGTAVRAGVSFATTPTWRIATDFVQWTPTLYHQSSLLSNVHFGVFSTGPKAMPMALLYSTRKHSQLTLRTQYRALT